MSADRALIETLTRENASLKLQLAAKTEECERFKKHSADTSSTPNRYQRSCSPLPSCCAQDCPRCRAWWSGYSGRYESSDDDDDDAADDAGAEQVAAENEEISQELCATQEVQEQERIVFERRMAAMEQVTQTYSHRLEQLTAEVEMYKEWLVYAREQFDTETQRSYQRGIQKGQSIQLRAWRQRYSNEGKSAL